MGGKKEDLIAKILKRTQVIHGQKSALLKLITWIEKKYYSNSFPIHNFYNSNFNTVDLLDRYWYKVHDSHGIWNWKAKMLHSIINFYIINSWTWFSTENASKWLTFRSNLAIQLINVISTE